MSPRGIPLGKIAAMVDGKVEGDGGTLINGVAAIEDAEAGHITFIAHPDKLPDGEQSNASALIVSPNTRTTKKPIVVTEDPKLAFSKILAVFAPEKPRLEPGVHQTAILGKNVTMGEDVAIGAHAVIGDNTVLADGVVIHPLAYVGHEATIGKESEIHPHVFIGDRVRIGEGTTIHAGSAIGSDGFGYLQTDQGHQKIPEVGTVVIGDNVDIGACCTVDRATVSVTRIGDGTKIDDHVHVAHNCVIGNNCLLCGQVGIAGSAVIGDNVTMGGQVGVNDHATIDDDIVVGAQAGVFGDLKEPGVYSGYPARPHQKQLRVAAASQRLPKLLKTIRALQKRVEELEERLDQAEGDGGQ